jgi:ribosome biogenesis GTPase
MIANQTNGIVLKKLSGFYYVQDAFDNLYECKLRGKIKQQVLTGDRVVVTLTEEQRGIIEEVLPRDNELYRPKIANVSMVLVIMAYDRPAPSMLLLDRLLFLTYYNGLKPVIVLNKCDIPESEKAGLIKSYYPQAGFNLILSSAKTGYGIDEIKNIIKGQVAVMAGPSGSGKTTLLNTLVSGLQERTQEVSNKIGRCKHTTRHVELYRLELGGFIADTPGFSVLDMPAVGKRELISYFPDLQSYTDNCEFQDCLHYKERICGVKQALANEIIIESRYKNYLTMLEEVIAMERCYK